LIGSDLAITWPTVREWIDITRLFVSWPVAALVAFYTLVNLFRSEIQSYLARLGKIKLSGIFEAEPQQPVTESSAVLVREEAESIVADAAPITDSGESEGAEGLYTEVAFREPGVHEELVDNETVSSVKSDELIALEAKVERWKFKYLERFLVPYTKRVLLWLSVLPQKRGTYDFIWQYVIPTENQREIVLNVLKQHRLISEIDEQLTVTDEGQRLIAYFRTRDQLPNMPIPSVSPPYVPADKPNTADESAESALSRLAKVGNLSTGRLQPE
jgi:hypothetical protein